MTRSLPHERLECAVRYVFDVGDDEAPDMDALTRTPGVGKRLQEIAIADCQQSRMRAGDAWIGDLEADAFGDPHLAWRWQALQRRLSVMVALREFRGCGDGGVRLAGDLLQFWQAAREVARS